MSNSPKKILLFSTAYLPRIGGAELALHYITDQLPDVSFDLITSRPHAMVPSRQRIGNIMVHRVGLGWAEWLDKLLLPILGSRLGAQLYQKNHYQAVFSLMASQGGGAAYLFKKQHPYVPLILNLQEGHNFNFFAPWKRFFFRLIVRASDYVTVLSNHLKDIAIAHGAKQHHVVVIPNGVDVDTFIRDFSYGELSSLSTKLGIRPDEKVIVSASRLVHKNGIDTLIKSLAILLNEWRAGRYKLLLIGGGVLKKKLERLAGDLGVLEEVIFLDTVGHDELPKYFRISHVFVRPSRSEGLGSAFLEAMAAGLPVVGTPIGGIPDFLKDGETGVFCVVDDPESVAKKIKLVSEDKELHNRIIENGYKLVMNGYTWRHVGQEYKKVFDRFFQASPLDFDSRLESTEYKKSPEHAQGEVTGF